MKILLFAPDAERPNGEGSYAHHNVRASFRQLGHQIVDYDFRNALRTIGRDEMGRQVKDLLSRERPDLFFHMHDSDELSDELAEYITQKTAATLVVFFSDDEWRLQESLKIADRYHVVITTCQEAVDSYRAHGIECVIYVPYACNPDLYYPLEGIAKQYDVTFVGQAYRGRPELIYWLKNQGVHIRVWGQGWEEHCGLRDIAGGFLPHKAMLEVIAASKIVLGMSWAAGDGVTLQIKRRTFEYAACRAFQLTTFDERLIDLFRANEEIVFYRDRKDLLGKIQHYLIHDDERERIAAAAYARALASHTWTRRFQQMLDDILRFRRQSVPGSPRRAQVPQQPTVAVLTYVYNGERYIEELIRSVLAQTYEDFEFLILDDGSTDGTKGIIQRYAGDPRVRYVYQDNIGRNLDAFHELINRCVALTSAPYVCFAGADDIFFPEKLAVQLAAFKEDPDLAIVFSDGYHIDANGRIIPSDFRFAESLSFTRRSLLRTLFKKNIVAHPTVMMKRTTIEELGGFEDGYTTDPQFWLKAAPHVRFRYLDRKLIKYRIHEGGASTGSRNRTIPETVDLLTRMRKRYTIRDLYPELADCVDQQQALYSAYVHFGNLLFAANVPVPALAVLEYVRALDHRPGGIEAVNNVAVGLWLLGAKDKSLPLFAALEEWRTTDLAVAHNLALLRHLQSGHERAGEGFVLLREPADSAELLRRLDPPHDDATARVCGGWPVAGIQRSGGAVHRSVVQSPTNTVTESVPDRLLPPRKPEQPIASSPDGPLVSVIIPTYNRPRQLRQAVDSVLNQTYRHVEIIVVNDAGEEVAGLLTGMERSETITYVRHGTNRDRAAARNTGLKLARGKYIAYLDDDDRFLPDHLQTLVEFLETHEYRVAYSDAWRVHEEQRGDRYVETNRDVPYSYDFDATRLLISNYIPLLSVVHERSCLDEVGLFDEQLTSHEDWDLWIRLSRRFPFAHIKKVTAEFTWRTDGSSTTSKNKADFARTARIIFDKYRSISEGIPGVRELQACALQELHAVAQRTLAYTCSIIVPVWNKAELTRQCLQALAATTHGIEYEVIIVDNGSTDETPALLAGLGGDVRVIRNQQNLGFARACNQGAKVAKGRYLVFLNNDTIPQPGWLEAMVREVEEHADVAVVGSKLLYADGTIQHAGVAFSRTWLTPYHLYRGYPADAPAVNRRREFQAVTAACMLVRREVFEEVGGFDEGYRNGFEDVDVCLKVRGRGRKIVYQPQSVLYHLESQTPGRNTHDGENSRLLRERWGQQWWLADEDLLAFEDGVRCDSPSPHLVRWRPLADDAEREVWRLVAETQRAALRRDDEAVRRLIREPGRWPADVSVLRWGAAVAKALDEMAAAGMFWQRLLTLCEDADARLALARQAVAEGRLDEAEGHLDRLPSHAANGGEAYLVRGVLAMQRHAFSQAAKAFETALTHGGDRRKALMGLGMASLGAGQLERSWDAFCAAVKQEPDDAEAMHWVLRAGTALGRWKDMAEVLSRFVDRNPGDLAARFALAGVLVREGRIEEARQEQQVLHLLDPQYEGLDALARALDGHPLCASSSVSG
jgi:GT2 family glycosyltransferase/Flp pilus assembly protein TadD